MSDVGHKSPLRAVESEKRRSWTEHLNAGFLALGRDRASALRETLATRSLEGDIWIEKQGVRSPIALALRPQLMDLASRGYLHHISWQMRMALRRAVRLTASVPEAAAVLPLDAVESEWIERYRQLGRRYGSPKGERIFCRLDALGRLEGPGWRERLRFVEVNVVGIGGMSYSPPADQLMLDHVIPALTHDDDDFAFDSNHDPRLLLEDELIGHARALGAVGKPGIAFIDDRDLYTLGGELGRLLPFFARRGLDVVLCDPRELELSASGDIVAQGRRIDVIYRFLEMRDLVEMEVGGADLRALHTAFEQNRVVPSAGGDFEHKSVFELFTDPRFAAAFDTDVRPVLDDHVMWTRLLYARTTTDPTGITVDLVPWVERNRERLVMKPNRGAGGEGVVIGDDTDEREWHRVLGLALADPMTHVVQSLITPVDEAFPLIEADGTPTLAPMYCAAGFFPGQRGLGIFGRYSPGPVVNIQAGGGIAPYLVAVR